MPRSIPYDSMGLLKGPKSVASFSFGTIKSWKRGFACDKTKLQRSTLSIIAISRGKLSGTRLPGISIEAPTRRLGFARVRSYQEPAGRPYSARVIPTRLCELAHLLKPHPGSTIQETGLMDLVGNNHDTTLKRTVAYLNYRKASHCAYRSIGCTLLRISQPVIHQTNRLAFVIENLFN